MPVPTQMCSRSDSDMLVRTPMRLLDSTDARSGDGLRMVSTVSL